MSRLFSSIVAVLFAAFTLIIQPSAQADTFGTSGNEFTIDFVSIGNAGNAADAMGMGAVPYEYRMGKYEISENNITKATASGMMDITWERHNSIWSVPITTGNQPAAWIQWTEAAVFVNWLNTSTGHQPAYNLIWAGRLYMQLWSSDQAWTAGGTNLYRNKDAYYFLPSENEWYKAAYYNAAGTHYFQFPTANSWPTPVASGTDAGTAVYKKAAGVPAAVDSAGGLSPYGTMGQGGNLREWTESAKDGSYSQFADRAVRGGSYADDYTLLRVTGYDSLSMGVRRPWMGFRVASVPEPSTYALLLMTGAGWLVWKRRKATR